MNVKDIYDDTHVATWQDCIDYLNFIDSTSQQLESFIDNLNNTDINTDPIRKLHYYYEIGQLLMGIYSNTTVKVIATKLFGDNGDWDNDWETFAKFYPADDSYEKEFEYLSNLATTIKP